MEQETRAVRLMVAGGLGQRTCPRSRCAARQSRALAASRLQGLPGAAAAARRQTRWWWGLGATPARLSPPLHNGASPAPPSGKSAKGRGAKQGERRRNRAGQAGAGRVLGPAHTPGSSLPAAPQLRGRASSGDVQGLSGVWIAGMSPDRVKGEGEKPTSFHFLSSQVSHPTALFTNLALRQPST